LRKGGGFESIVRLSQQHQLSSYDAAYLDLAVVEGLPLATLDKNLRAAAKRAEIELLKFAKRCLIRQASYPWMQLFSGSPAIPTAWSAGKNRQKSKSISRKDAKSLKAQRRQNNISLRDLASWRELF
jgi:hypothetical protein